MSRSPCQQIRALMIDPASLVIPYLILCPSVDFLNTSLLGIQLSQARNSSFSVAVSQPTPQSRQMVFSSLHMSGVSFPNRHQSSRICRLFFKVDLLSHMTLKAFLLPLPKRKKKKVKSWVSPLVHRFFSPVFLVSLPLRIKLLSLPLRIMPQISAKYPI